MYSLETKTLDGGYPKNSVFSDFSLAVPMNKFVSLTGPNGSGKSTLLKFFYRELIPQNGLVYLQNQKIDMLKQKDIARILGFVPQNGKIDYGFTVRQAVAMGRYAYNGTDKDHAIETALKDCDIEELQEKRVTEISGGEMQRVLLARALCQDAKILLLDEPVNHLDVKHQRKMMNLLRHLVEKDLTVVCVLHDLLLVQVYSDEVILLQKGKIMAEGTVESVITKENLLQVYGVQSHQVFDSMLNKNLWMPTWY
ncbi:ABC transporter ATP-binding protein [uncultured Sphaerochaeta sp.]|uniref:ABC transporter ATP-binding protein n=1 Tax=uncultured Sphaerochaeta sp. TaxID=886478 RepID=UPI002A0A1EB2|nr:ABC transporter ATP-binding protein [uncultured Sphaerochaeta sp.]